MSVGLGTLKSVDDEPIRRIEVDAFDYNADHIRLSASNGISVEIELVLDRRQMQELTIIIDRFLDK